MNNETCFICGRTYQGNPCDECVDTYANVQPPSAKAANFAIKVGNFILWVLIAIVLLALVGFSLLREVTIWTK